jgi:hypothetical protein
VYRPRVRAFEKFDFSLLKDGELALMTVVALGDPKERMHVADFRDVQALFLPSVKRWVGMSHTRGLRFGVGPLRLVDGVWYCVEDVESQKGREDFQLSPEALSLEVIR